jgi:hypothetical protein
MTEEVWWNTENLLPNRFVIEDGNGTITFRVERLAHRIDDALLRTPVARFSTYQTFDLADWLEERAR